MVWLFSSLDARQVVAGEKRAVIAVAIKCLIAPRKKMRCTLRRERCAVVARSLGAQQVRQARAHKSPLNSNSSCHAAVMIHSRSSHLCDSRAGGGGASSAPLSNIYESERSCRSCVCSLQSRPLLATASARSTYYQLQSSAPRYVTMYYVTQNVIGARAAAPTAAASRLTRLKLARRPAADWRNAGTRQPRPRPVPAAARLTDRAS